MALPWATTERWVPGIDDQGRVYFEEFGGGYGLDVPARRPYLLRCDAGTGGCEVALEPGWGGGMRHPVCR